MCMGQYMHIRQNITKLSTLALRRLSNTDSDKLSIIDNVLGHSNMIYCSVAMFQLHWPIS